MIELEEDLPGESILVSRENTYCPEGRELAGSTRAIEMV
jgi:hypothetical protein